MIKQSLFLSKIQKAGVKKYKKRGRSKKFTNLGGLGDALPNIVGEGIGGLGQRELKNGAVLHSLRSKPGVAKQREKMVKAESDRFGKNLALLSQARSSEVSGLQQEGGSRSRRWAALRAHIQSSMGQGVSEVG